MSRSWPYLTAVAVVGVLAGVAIGGKPVPRDPFVLSPDQIPTTTVSVDTTAAVPAPAPTTAGAVTGSTTTTPVATGTTGPGTTGPGTTGPGTDSSTASSTGFGATTRVVLADASGTATTLGSARDALTAAGYTQVATSPVAVPEASSTVYYRAGFAAQAAEVSGLLGVAQAPLVALIDQVVSSIDAQGDVVVLLGSDVAAP
jgi:hypothetical protein